MAEFKSSILSTHFHYSQVRKDLTEELICDTFTLINPSPEDNYFDWIYVPVNKESYNTYLVDELYKYAEINNDNIPDPHRGYPNINFMKTRINRYYNMSAEAKNVKIKDVTDSYCLTVLNNILDFYKNNNNNENDNNKNMNDLGVLVNMRSFIDNNMIFDLDVNRAAAIVDKKPTGSFMIRSSSCSNLCEEFTVFTITHSYYETGKHVNNLRCLIIHGVGVYFVGDRDKSYFDGLTKKKFLQDINYAPADYACIMDIIIQLHKCNRLDINKLIFNMP